MVISADYITLLAEKAYEILVSFKIFAHTMGYLHNSLRLLINGGVQIPCNIIMSV